MGKLIKPKEIVNCWLCSTEFNITKYGEGECPKCGLLHMFTDGEYLPHPSDIVKVNLKNSPELLEDGAWYPVVDASGNQDCLFWREQTMRFENGNLEPVLSLDAALWIGAKIQFPEID